MQALKIVTSPITQEEIEAIIGLQNQIMQLDRMMCRRQEDILRRLLAGNPVEAGIHLAEIEQVIEGGSQTTRVVLR